MLKHHNSPAIVAVSDLARARGLNSDVLGLELDESGGGKRACPTSVTRWWFRLLARRATTAQVGAGQGGVATVRYRPCETVRGAHPLAQGVMGKPPQSGHIR